MKSVKTSFPNAIRGLTLVEIMVALVLSLLLSAGAIQIYISNKISYQTADALSRIQENGRFAIEFLTKEIRMAGFTGCPVTKTANAIDDTSGNWKYDFTNSVLGYEGGTSTFPTEIASSVISGSDAIIISRGDDTNYYIDFHNPVAASIKITSTTDIQKGEILMIADCLNSQAGIFQMSKANTSNAAIVVDHATGNSATPGNCTVKLKGNFDCDDLSGAVSAAYDEDSKLLRMKNTIFYIANGRNNSSGASIPSLYQSYIAADGSGGVTVLSNELIEGIENFQILYGIDTDGTADGIANRYVAANDVSDWKTVTSVRLYLLARSIEPIGGEVKPYTYMGTTSTTHTDTYIRRQFTATIQVRNHGLDL